MRRRKMQIYEQLHELIRSFEEAGIDYALCGGLAMAAHGWPRATMDIDLLIEEEDLSKARGTARKLGFAIEPGEMKLSGGRILIHRMVKVAGSEALPLDLVLVTPALLPVWESRHSLQTESGPISVVSADGLILMKKLRRSGQDEDDIRRLKGETESES